MKTTDLISSAVSNTFRSKTRTLLTILSIFIGAFTLSITSGLGTGINSYIDDTLSGAGAADAMSVSKTSEAASGFGPPEAGPAEYDPDAVSAGALGAPGATVTALTPDDITAIGQIEDVVAVEAQRTITPDYIQFGNGARYVAGAGSLTAGQTMLLANGADPDDDSADLQLSLPASYVEPLGFDDSGSAIGKTLVIGITDAQRKQHDIEATIVGVTEEALASAFGSSILMNEALGDALFEKQSTGLSSTEADKFANASVRFDPGVGEDGIAALKDRLAEAGYEGTTTADQLGMITSVVDGIVLVLNAFAILALLTAAFGIVNTLFMSVQERTREIGLMKAMGMGSGKVFGMFSLEATFIGFLGSAIGAGLAIAAGTGLSALLSRTLLADLPGLQLIAFDPMYIGGIILLVMVIAFLAGTIPAARAAKADPVESLRYE
ncbi:ABC transporter permease [Paeniglutamicibacter sp. MACA_103]|uniref:ABC transporter permease n=1 Tax=Paeniglutamicibacter sp. MACA_103 TaxID=3377337 RepID=UPI0038939229